MTTKKPFKPALLVIDMQHDFVHGSLAVPDGAATIPLVNQLLQLPFAVKIATKDWHPENHISFAQRHQKEPFTNTTVHPPGENGGRTREQELWPVHCVQSSPGAAFVEGLNQEAIEHVITKGEHPDIDSYSALQDVWKINQTNLPELLRGLEVTDVFLAGLAGDYCVKFTALDTVDFGFETWVVKDACRSVFDSGEEWREMTSRGVKIIQSIDEVKGHIC